MWLGGWEPFFLAPRPPHCLGLELWTKGTVGPSESSLCDGSVTGAGPLRVEWGSLSQSCGLAGRGWSSGRMNGHGASVSRGWSSRQASCPKACWAGRFGAESCSATGQGSVAV